MEFDDTAAADKKAADKKQWRDMSHNRLAALLRRFVMWEDVLLSDRDLVETVYKRWANGRDAPLIDPNE